MERGIKDGIRISKGVRALVEALLLPALNSRTGPWPASLSYSPVGLAGRLTQGFHQAQDFRAIAMKI